MHPCRGARYAQSDAEFGASVRDCMSDLVAAKGGADALPALQQQKAPWAADVSEKLKGGSKSEARSGDSGQTKGWKMLRAAVNVKSAFKQQRPSIMKMKSVKEVTEL